MRLITTYREFVQSEITEYGHDWVEAQFLLGYEPTVVNNVWCWRKNVITLMPPHNDSNTLSHKRT